MTTTAYDIAKNFGYLTGREVELLTKMAQNMCEEQQDDPIKIVNIGAGAGTSALALREGCSRAIIWSIDKSPGGPLGGFEGETNAFRQAGLPPPQFQILGDSADIGKNWDLGQIDLLFVDGDHHEIGIEADIRSWFPHLRIGGIILFHDYGKTEWPDVKVVVDDLMKNQSHMSIIDTISMFKKTSQL